MTAKSAGATEATNPVKAAAPAAAVEAAEAAAAVEAVEAAARLLRLLQLLTSSPCLRSRNINTTSKRVRVQQLRCVGLTATASFRRPLKTSSRKIYYRRAHDSASAREERACTSTWLLPHPQENPTEFLTASDLEQCLWKSLGSSRLAQPRRSSNQALSACDWGIAGCEEDGTGKRHTEGGGEGA